MTGEKTNIKGMSREELESFVLSLGEKSFRARQIWSWMYYHGKNEFDAMTTISRDLRTRLDSTARISCLKPVRRTDSESWGTRKYLWELEDGLHVESVYLPESPGNTVCISSQVGCPLGCAFCATGTLGLIRNLHPHEIVDQVLQVRNDIPDRLTNIVVMGMGDPFLNYDAVMKALHIIRDPEGIAIGHRKITLSTAGVVPALYRYIEEEQPFQLAVSLNATTNEIRDRLMPVNRKYPLERLLEAVRVYSRSQRKRVTFEYVLIREVNDTPEDARRLRQLLHGIPCKINLIPYNSTTPDFQGPEPERIEAFAIEVRRIGAPVTMRHSRGQDINGACGQLVADQAVP